MNVPSLRYIDADGSHSVVLDRASTSIGRSPSQDVVLSDAFVSRRHAVIVRDGTAYTLIDQESSHGTFLNAERVQRMALKPGDVIELKPKSKANNVILGMIGSKNNRINWVEWNEKDLKGTYLTHPERESVPENIKEQLIVELYSK